MTVFRFLLLTLAAYRLTRLLTADDLPPSKAFRDWVRHRTGHDSAWSTLVHCEWCSGVWGVAGVFLVDRYWWTPPIWLLAMVAAMTLVGILGSYAERE